MRKGLWLAGVIGILFTACLLFAQSTPKRVIITFRAGLDFTPGVSNHLQWSTNALGTNAVWSDLAVYPSDGRLVTYVGTNRYPHEFYRVRQGP